MIRWVITGDKQFMAKTHISYTNSFNIPVSIGLTTLAHMLNLYGICLNTTNHMIFNMRDFRYLLCTSILDCFSHVVTTLCNGHLQSKHLLPKLARLHVQTWTHSSLTTWTYLSFRTTINQSQAYSYLMQDYILSHWCLNSMVFDHVTRIEISHTIYDTLIGLLLCGKHLKLVWINLMVKILRVNMCSRNRSNYIRQEYFLFCKSFSSLSYIRRISGLFIANVMWTHWHVLSKM